MNNNVHFSSVSVDHSCMTIYLCSLESEAPESENKKK